MPVNSRIQALLEQRRASSGYSTGGVKTRVLSPSSTSGISAIARQTLNAEIAAKVDQYNNGKIGNDEMLAFLNSQAVNPILTPNERVSIQSQIADFQDKIVGDKLKANFESAPKGGMAQIQAAQAVADYYQSRADGMVSGTPAQSTALQNAGNWKQTVVDLNNSANRTTQNNLKDQLQVAISALPTGSSRSTAEANMYKQLYDLAVSQGDTEAANNYAASLNQYNTTATSQASKEQIDQKASEADVAIAKMTKGSADEAKTKADKALEMFNLYSGVGDTVNANKWQAVYIDATQEYDKLVAGDPKKEMQANVDSVLNKLREYESAYKYGKKITFEDGTSGYITGPALADAKHTAYATITQYYQQGMDNGIAGLEDNIRKYQDLTDGVVNELQTWANGEMIDVVGKSGLTSTINVSDPEERKKYIEGANGNYYKALLPTSNVAGASALTPQEAKQYLASGRAYTQKDENGQPVYDFYGNPKVVPEQYVDIPTAKGTERVWSKHDESGNLVGWLPEKATGTVGVEGKLMEKPISYVDYMSQFNASTPQGPVSVAVPTIAGPASQKPPEVSPVSNIPKLANVPTQNMSTPTGAAYVPPQVSTPAPNTSTRNGAVYTPPPALNLSTSIISQPSSSVKQTSTPMPVSTPVSAPTPSWTDQLKKIPIVGGIGSFLKLW